MKLKLHFDNAVAISGKSVRDDLKITVLDNVLFWAEKTLMRIPIDYKV